MLAVAVVLFLAVGVSEGVILNKCSLKQDLQANLTLPSTMPNMLAQIVCQVQMTSNFNTSAIKVITEVEKIKQIKIKAGRSRTRRSKGHKVTAAPTIEEIWTLYGIFQLSDHVACNSTLQPYTLNLCGMPCSNLLNSDITDDVACVQTLINKMTTAIFDRKAVDAILEMMLVLEHPECLTKRDSGYFSSCS